MKKLIGILVWVLVFGGMFFGVEYLVMKKREDWIRVEGDVVKYESYKKEVYKQRKSTHFSVDSDGIQQTQETPSYAIYSNYTITFTDNQNTLRTVNYTCKSFTGAKKQKAMCPVVYMQGTKQMVTLFYNPEDATNYVFADREGKPFGGGNDALFQ